MKKILPALFISMLVIFPSFITACPKCNKDFYNELVGKRANSLGGQELIEAIRNQTIPGQTTPFELPELYQNKAEDPAIITTDNSSVLTENNYQFSFAAKIHVFMQVFFLRA
ncbi:hypothetical protein BH10BAC5_BH10BAC5_00500 [soil metagenome]